MTLTRTAAWLSTATPAQKAEALMFVAGWFAAPPGRTISDETPGAAAFWQALGRAVQSVADQGARSRGRAESPRNMEESA